MKTAGRSDTCKESCCILYTLLYYIFLSFYAVQGKKNQRENQTKNDGVFTVVLWVEVSLGYVCECLHEVKTQRDAWQLSWAQFQVFEIFCPVMCCHGKCLKVKTDSLPLFSAKRISSCETLIMLFTWSKYMSYLIEWSVSRQVKMGFDTIYGNNVGWS